VNRRYKKRGNKEKRKRKNRTTKERRKERLNEGRERETWMNEEWFVWLSSTSIKDRFHCNRLTRHA
jgi:hypothetical protein